MDVSSMFYDSFKVVLQRDNKMKRDKFLGGWHTYPKSCTPNRVLS